jgi:hypothetical protein
MSKTTTTPNLVKDTQAQVKALTKDLRDRSELPEDAWAKELRTEYDKARGRNRTGLTWSEWRDGEVDLAAVAWVLATVFIRFCEDNGLIDGPWITGEGNRHSQAADNETDFYQKDPTRNSRDWLRAGFAALADLPAGKDLVDKHHNLVWRAPISADAASNLLNFWRSQNTDGTLTHDFTDDTLDTRFLGDLYQDLSDYAKKKYALLQTPIFVEEFILDRTLTPAIEEFGIQGLKLIDPTCGSGHFLLGAFDRLIIQWQNQFPAMDTRTRIQNALDSIHGVDLNPFAVAIARFRITVSALKAAGTIKLKDAPAFKYHIAVGDSLIKEGVQIDLLASEEEFVYSNEDVAEHPGIKARNRYHVVVGNPPYITVKDKALNERYRQDYKTCKGKYALSVPFMELFFELAIKGEANKPAGFVGQITSNSFMKREFGKPLIEDLLSGTGRLSITNPVDLINVLDTSGAYVPGHGTPTVILIGRHRKPVGNTIRAALGVRGEPGAPRDPAKGLVWTELVTNVDLPESNGQYLTIADLPRQALAVFPWSLSGGGAGGLRQVLDQHQLKLATIIDSAGFAAITGDDEIFVRGKRTGSLRQSAATTRPFVEGEQVRDFQVVGDRIALFPYPIAEAIASLATYWPFRTNLRAGLAFQQTREDRGLWWGEYILPNWPRLDAAMLITFAFVATHNHFVLDRGGKVFKQSAPVIKLPDTATEDDYLDLLGVLNSSTACFWLKQVSHNKGDSTDTQGARVTGDPAFDTYEFTGTKLQEFPLVDNFPRDRARALDRLAQQLSAVMPAEVLKSDVESLQKTLEGAYERWVGLRQQMIFVQEELDWEVYRSYGLIDSDLTYSGSGMDVLVLGQRSFEIALARKMAAGLEKTAWFERHGSAPITEIPADWPADYVALVRKRLDLIESDAYMALVERPEYKRRWAGDSWETMQDRALREFVLDRLEVSGLWFDDSGPLALSVAQLADRVRGDSALVEAVRLLRGAVEVDLTFELGKLIAEESVPFLSAYRYKDSGLRKRAEWESVWELQRREDAGESVSIPVPPKYAPTDFRKPTYWKARGKLDVPKERFTSFIGAQRPGDSSLIIGWAGWDHLEQARGLARLIVDRSHGDGLSTDALLPLVAGLIELEPWLYQWYGEADVLFGGASPAVFFTGFIDSQLSGVGASRADAKGWKP